MAEPLHVLVYGSVDAGVCDFVRLGVYRDLLRGCGVELRTWGELNDYRVRVPTGYEGRVDDAFRDGVAAIDTSPIDWADVLVFRRWYGTVQACEGCDYVASDGAALAAHAGRTGHTAATPDHIIRPLLWAIEHDVSFARGRAIVYELDDDLPAAQPWLGFYARLRGDLDLIERFARRADLVTVATPALAASLGRYNSAVRVIRNAVVPEWYAAPESGPALESGQSLKGGRDSVSGLPPGSATPGSATPESTTGPESAPAHSATPPGKGDPSRPLSFLYYGQGVRTRDYAICRDAVDEAARRYGGRRLWLGSDEPAVRALVDEARPYVADVRGFARQLAAAQPAIGLAPVGQDDYSRSRSELHWLEYSLVGAATVASRTMGHGPYDMIRDGVDGLLARNKGEWRDKLNRLAASRTMQEEIAGRAGEKVRVEYDVRGRVVEWADAFRWAAEHAGRGMGAAAGKRSAD